MIICEGKRILLYSINIFAAIMWWIYSLREVTFHMAPAMSTKSNFGNYCFSESGTIKFADQQGVSFCKPTYESCRSGSSLKTNGIAKRRRHIKFNSQVLLVSIRPLEAPLNVESAFTRTCWKQLSLKDVRVLHIQNTWCCQCHRNLHRKVIFNVLANSMVSLAACIILPRLTSI